ncbi:MAG TPA: hypothetical protein PL009_11370 [Flavipsychrobacter sp.]|nr:hypothetical protein [Flavipsychrobacter sp.]
MESHNQRQDIFNLTIDEEAKAHLLETSRWTKFIAIIGFVFMGLLILLGLFMGLGLSAFSEFYGSNGLGSTFGVGMMAVYFVIAVLYFFPIFYLYKYSVLIKPAIMGSNQQQFNLALSYQRRMFKFIGILFLIILGLYALMFVVGIIGAAVGSM